MKMAFRWYGDGNDQVTLNDIREIPGVDTVVWSLHHKQAGDEWTQAEIDAEVAKITGITPEDAARGVTKRLNAEVVESVNVHESIKLGKDILGRTRDEAIHNYITAIERLGKAGVKVICYNFMPVFDCLRTDMFHPLPDGSTALYYEKAIVDKMTPESLIASMEGATGGLTLPGWEPERLASFQEIRAAYVGVTREDMYRNYKYFLDAVVPAAEAAGIRLGVHPDDPAFDIFGWPRVVSRKADLARVLSLNDSPANGLTLCLGSFGSNPDSDVVDAVKTFMDRIVFSHVRNILHYSNGDFTEVGHRANEGSIDTIGIMKAYADADYQGYIRPDHGRHIWDENTTKKSGVRPGYGLYDRALGTQYLLGVWDAARYDRDPSVHPQTVAAS